MTERYWLIDVGNCNTVNNIVVGSIERFMANTKMKDNYIPIHTCSSRYW